MNERIKELAGQCRIETYGVNGELLEFGFDEEKFAKLIVKETIIEMSIQMREQGDDQSNNPAFYKAIIATEKHLGVNNASI